MYFARASTIWAGLSRESSDLLCSALTGGQLAGWGWSHQKPHSPSCLEPGLGRLSQGWVLGLLTHLFLHMVSPHGLPSLGLLG